MATNELANKIPDLWFDWYGRFIPGALALLVYLHFTEYNLKQPSSWGQTVLFALVAYLIGHFTQPISSQITGYYKKKFDNESLYLNAKQNPEIAISTTRLVSKAYAEASGMASAAFLIFIMPFVLMTKDASHLSYILILWPAALILLVFTRMSMSSRNRKILGLYAGRELPTPKVPTTKTPKKSAKHSTKKD